eukprot:SAG22_NODE_2656_length_2332_cov_5.785490_2_plen_74_part_00
MIALSGWTDGRMHAGVLNLFMRSVEQAAAGFCQGRGDGRIGRDFDEASDTKLWTGPAFIDELTAKAGSCWGGK